ncbi:DUF4157 domain-containing protein [Streptomyces sp. NPDC047315]|uniref:eCIS core domain-containing protein n=1 Tax=Streptomyces sp. NPDC047315 TaxID=3155142 RepID=UPI003404812C
MLQLSGYSYAQGRDQHAHGAGCGHQQQAAGRAPAVQRSAVHDVLSGTGRPLDTGLREEMESRLGSDFSDVRIHDDQAARASAAGIGARAYTSGSDVVLGDGGSDKHTLAHELTHVIQQRRGPVAGTDRGDGLSLSHPDDRFEREAEANATRVMRGPAVSPSVPVQEFAEAGGGHDAGQPTVQRVIMEVDPETKDPLFGLMEPEEADEHFAGQGLPEEIMQGLRDAAGSEEEYYTVAEAMARARHTITGAVNLITPNEGQLIADLARKRGSVGVYDPDMMPLATSVLQRAGVPDGAVEVTKGSITEFGHHRSHTDIFVPHPGPWVTRTPPDDLASCLEHVMGTASRAYVLTDNEPFQGFAEHLTARIKKINTENGQTQGYIPLTFTVEELESHEDQPVELTKPGLNVHGGTDSTSVRYKPTHRPDFNVIRVSRA